MKKENLKKFILAGVIAVIVCVILGFVCWRITYSSTTATSTSLSTGWTASFNGQAIESQGDGDIGNYTFSDLERGDVIVLESTLPDGVEENELASIFVYYSVVDVYVDNELVYSYGHDAYNKGQLVGSGYHYVNMPENAGGKQLSIEVTAAEDNAFTNIVAPRIGDATVIYQEFISDNLLGVVIGTFLLILGAVLLIVGCAAVPFNKNFSQLICIGLLSFSLSLWYLCDVCALSLIGVDLAVMSTVKYFLLYFMPIPFVLILISMLVGKPGWRMRFLHFYTVIMSVFLVVTTCLHYLDIVHYVRFLTCFHTLLAIGVIFIIVAAVTVRSKKQQLEMEIESSTRIAYIGATIFVLCAALETIEYNLRLYVLQDDSKLMISFIPFGLLIMILCFVLSYIFRTYDIFVANAQKGLLETLAYTDMLCQVSNRAKYNEDIAEIMNSNQEYAFVNMDVDGLKKVNDNMGHGMGDELLMEFSDILKQAFYNIGDVYRMGGDEFLVIVKGEKLDDINFAIEQMTNLAQKRSADLPFTIEFSYGIANSTESTQDTPEQLYTLADRRMYTMKNQRKMRKQMR